MTEPISNGEHRTNQSARPPDIGQHSRPLREEERQWLSLEAAESIPDSADPWRQAENRAELERYLATRPDADQEILHALIFEGTSPSDVAGQLGISPVRVSQAYAHAISALREWFKHDGVGPEDF